MRPALGLTVSSGSDHEDDLWQGPDVSPFLHRKQAVRSAQRVWDLQVVVLRTLARCRFDAA